jgi:hypothetical protein
MENVATFYGHLEYVYYGQLVYLGPFGNLHSSKLVHFSAIWYIVSRKNWQPSCSVQKHRRKAARHNCCRSRGPTIFV